MSSKFDGSQSKDPPVLKEKGTDCASQLELWESKETSQKGKSLYLPAVANPFGQHTRIGAWRWVRIVLLGAVLVPVRVCCCFILFLFLWPFVILATIGRPVQPARPASNCRRQLTQPALRLLLQAVFRLLGFVVRVRGAKATRAEARLFVVAPHTTFFDVIACVAAGLPSLVLANRKLTFPGLRKVIQSTEPILVRRNDPASRKNTRNEILRRVRSGRRWRQIMIFPEGVCTNGSCLVTFKLGAFLPGVPVQPVLLRYPNTLDTVTWTWKGFSAFQIVLLTLSQAFTRMTIEFMPVYTPSDDEKQDPILFANTVRISMANALGLPVTDHTYEDCKLMISAGHLRLPMEAGLVEFTKLSQTLKLDWDSIQQHLDDYAAIAVASKGGKIGIEEFATFLKLPVSMPLRKLFALFDRNQDGSIDFREYVIGLTILCNPDNTEKILQVSFMLFDLDKDGFISEQELTTILQAAFGVPDLDVSKLFHEIAGPDKKHISFKTFKKFGLKHPVYAKLFSSYLDLQTAHSYSLPQAVEV
ncbi:lysophosphatidylcholine acyltransferase 2B-like [Echinops telfairi]|uniref:Lysophosphatidylcholine acyltransferase 2B-like n=1 Tax=Echinops telfairi TaxID=9371 RepID=A0ABM0IGN4_ECHTE|nr:lysophosphatidylcholine acyltransferase 2B-like [Echinops telfairi]